MTNAPLAERLRDELLRQNPALEVAGDGRLYDECDNKFYDCEALVEALRFYADRDHNRLPSEGPWGVNSTDFGAKARAALAAYEGERT